MKRKEEMKQEKGRGKQMMGPPQHFQPYLLAAGRLAGGGAQH